MGLTHGHAATLDDGGVREELAAAQVNGSGDSGSRQVGVIAITAVCRIFMEPARAKRRLIM
jgi:hypothetical protein